MFTYSLQIIPGTQQYVQTEITQKFPAVSIISISPSKIIIQSNNSDIFSFQSLLSPLSITNDQKYSLCLYKRSWRTHTLPASLNPSLAYILCQIAHIQPTDTIYDPFCGCGTIPITVSQYFSTRQIFGSDLSGKAIDCCQTNLSQAISPIHQKITFFRSNISMVKLRPSSIDKIITNLPFGIRVGDHLNNQKIYRIFRDKTNSLLAPTGLGIILTQEKKLFYEIFSKKFKVTRVATIEQGGLAPDIFMIKKLLQ